MIRRLINLSLLLLLLIQKGSAQVLYACERPGTDTITFILGTHHNISNSNFQFDSLLTQLISESDKIFVEEDATDSSDERNLNLSYLRSVIRYPENKKLKDFLSPEQLQVVRNFYKKEFGSSPTQFEFNQSLTPFFLHNLLMSRSRKYFSIDQLINQQASRLGKTIISLDQKESRKEIYEWLSRSITPDSLYHLANNYAPVRKSLYQLEADYLRADTAGINNYITLQYTDEYKDFLLTKRNRKWEEILQAESGRVNFIAVGIAHVTYQNGLLTFYQRLGYKITPLAVQFLKD